jgi:hypothetical protein
MNSGDVLTRHRDTGFLFRNQKLACVATFALVFLVGALLGGLFMSTAGHSWLHRSAPFWTESGKRISVEKWSAELNLTPAQAADVSMILEDFAKYYRTVTVEAKARILKILDEEQRVKFQKMVEDARH